jgi:serine/threonine-protein kinase
MLTGRAPYDTTTLSELEINNKVVKDPLPRMKEFYPHISDKMQKMVDKATAKEPEKRFQNCGDFRKTLKNVLNPEPIKRVIKIAIAALVVMMLGGGFAYWDHNRVKTYYYKDYVEQWGVPVGIHKLSASQARHRNTSYRFEYTQKKLRSLALVNSKGNIAEDIDAERFSSVQGGSVVGRPISEPEWFDRPINATFSYRANGNIDYVLYRDRSGKVLFKKSYDEGRDGKINMFTFRYNDEYGTEKQLPKDMTGYVRLDNEFAERGNVSRFALTFDERGFVSAIHYRNVNQPVGDGEHIYGKRYERDEKGRVIKEYFLGHDDSVRATSWGLGMKQFEYNADDNWVKAVYLAPDGSPAYNAKGGVTVLAMEYEPKYGNRTYSWYQALDGSLTIPEKYGVAGKKVKYNEAGQKIELFYLGTDKNPMYSTVTRCIGEQYEYDENGYLGKFTYIDENKQAAFGLYEHSAVIKYKNDSMGNRVEERYFNIDNEPYEGFSGCSKVVFEYDHVGNPLSCRYYDTKDVLCLSREGMAGWSREYNDQNQLIKETYFGTDNQPAENNDGNIVIIEDRDIRGNVIKHAFYEADEKTLKLNNDGIAGWKSEYDNSKETKREYFDEKEQLTQGNYDYAKWEAAYDDMGNRTEISYFDKKSGFLYGYKNTYDTRGNLVERFRFGKDKRLAQDYLIQRWKYDDSDNCVEIATYENNNKLAENMAGYAKVTYAFDDRNQETEKRYYNENGKLFVNPEEGYAIQKIEYDNRGNETKVAYFNAAEKPLRRVKKGSYTYAVQIKEFDAFNRLVRSTFFDEQGKPTKPGNKVEDGAPPELLYGHDKWGHTNYRAWADGSGNLTSIGGDYAICRTEYDIRGNILSDSYYDKDDKPCVDKQRNVHKLVWAYDKQNRWIEFSCYDINNKPCVDKNDNTHKIARTYDAQGNITETRFYDASVSLRKDNYAIEKNKYDERNREIERAWYDYLDRPFNNSSLGGHRRVNSYDKSGVIYRTYYAINNTITAEWKYDPRTDQWTRSDGWRRDFGNTMKRLPITLNDYTTVTVITITGNTCTITLRINFSKYDLSGEDMLTLENEAKEDAEFWREDYEMPGNATLVVVGIDNAGRELYRVSY